MYCAKCGTEISEGTSFCHKCGTIKGNSSGNIMYCMNCGTKLSDDTEFCHMCGTKIIRSKDEKEAKSEQEIQASAPVVSESVEKLDDKTGEKTDEKKEKVSSFERWLSKRTAVEKTLLVIGAPILYIIVCYIMIKGMKILGFAFVTVSVFGLLFYLNVVSQTEEGKKIGTKLTISWFLDLVVISFIGIITTPGVHFVWEENKNVKSVAENNKQKGRDENIDSQKTQTNDGVKVVGIGEEFGNKTITGVVKDVNLNYTGYNGVWTDIPNDKKAIYIRIMVTNISNKSNYVSVGDFDCYVDNISTDAELISGSDDDYNANIESGRSAILGAMYVVPKDAESIELEYNPLGEYAERVIIKIL